MTSRQLVEVLAALVAAGLLVLAFLFVLIVLGTPVHAGNCTNTATVSWYGAESGSRTATGAFFDGSQMIVAHKSLPFGTRVRFEYRGRSVTVPVGDRGPYIGGRSFDLSQAAAAQLGIIGVGVARGVCWSIVR